jgi:phenylalanyl-tRNA synthetase beta chain
VLHPISELHTILRTTILPSLLEIFALNQHHPLPQRIFAVGEVVENRKTKLNLAFASIHSSANFSEIRSVADAVLQEMMIKAGIELSKDGAFLLGRAADIIDGEKTIGVLG